MLFPHESCERTKSQSAAGRRFSRARKRNNEDGGLSSRREAAHNTRERQAAIRRKRAREKNTKVEQPKCVLSMTAPAWRFRTSSARGPASSRHIARPGFGAQSSFALFSQLRPAVGGEQPATTNRSNEIWRRRQTGRAGGATQNHNNATTDA